MEPLEQLIAAAKADQRHRSRWLEVAALAELGIGFDPGRRVVAEPVAVDPLVRVRRVRLPVR